MAKATNLYAVMIYMTEFQQFSNCIKLHFSFQYIDLQENTVNHTLNTFVFTKILLLLP